MRLCRASQDLNVASLDRMRLETYLGDVRETAIKEPDQLEARSKTTRSQP